MWVRNETWKRIRPEFSSAQITVLTEAVETEHAAHGMYFALSTVPAWLGEKLKAAVTRIEPGA